MHLMLNTLKHLSQMLDPRLSTIGAELFRKPFFFSFLAPACQRSYKVKQPGKDGLLNLARIVSAARCHTMSDSFPI